jgi:hypothetical protein
LLYTHAFCQSDILTDLSNSFNQAQKEFAQEKMYLHTDKSFYLAGEIIWFKLYNVEAGSNILTDLSKVAYVEVVGKDQKSVLQAKISLRNGLGSGSLYIPFTFGSGNFILRAYTSWMKNLNADHFYEKNITIINSTKSLGLKPKIDSTQFDIQFFPEGGNLVNDLESKVAFRMVDKTGKFITAEGIIVGKNKDTIVSFHPFKFGIGHFVFTPHADNQYKAIVKISDTNSVTIPLPTALTQGYAMELKDTTDNEVAIMVRSINIPSNQPVFLIVSSHDAAKVSRVEQMNNNLGVFLVKKDLLDDGVSRFTVFNSNRQPVCERSYFKRPVQQLLINVKSDKEGYDFRKKISIDLSTADRSGKPILADLSLAVYKTSALEPGGKDNIFSYLWLTSDLKGNIESPEFYFNESSQELDEATDNLMLVNGWTRYRWEDISQHKRPVFEFAPEYEGHIIVGKVIDKNTGEPVEDVQTFLSVPAKNFLVASSNSDAQGIVHFDLKNFFGTDAIAVQTANAKDSNYRIDILNPFSEKNTSAKIYEMDTLMLTQRALVSSSINSQVQNVFAGENLQDFYPYKLADSTKFYGKPDQKYFLDDYTRFNTMEEVMREYVANITVRKHDGHFHFKVLNYPYGLFFEDDPLVLFDGIPVTDINKIIEFDPLKIQKIELMNRKYFLGPYTADGIISFSTYKGDLAGFQFDPNVVILRYDGLQLQREFYAPVYDTPEKAESRLPDFRNVLYWSPDLNIDQSGQKQLSFYTSDVKGKYIIVVQGVTADGKPGSATSSFTVGN